MTLGSNLQKYTYSYLMNQALARVPNTVDKREGSIIYDALGPACYVLAQFYLELYEIVLETYILTATGEWLDNRTIEFGIHRQEATAAVKRADFQTSVGAPATVNIGNRFATISTTVPLFYVVIGPYLDEMGSPVPGAYQLQCETVGIVGHTYTGPIIPVDYLPAVAVASMSTTVIPGQDVETDDELRQRYIERVNSRPFGGNISQYRELVLDIDGVGDCQIYPVWDGGGTVKISIVDSDRRSVTPEFIAIIQNMIDPDNVPELQGTGLGEAPIDHKVTVTTPDEVECNIECTISLLSGYTLPQVEPLIIEALEEYLGTLRSTWGSATSLNEYSLTLYIARVIATILSVSGVANVTDTEVNESSDDLVFLENSTTQQIPILGTVVINIAD